MKEFLVDLEIVSSTCSLQELSHLIGAPPGSGSHARGEPAAAGRVWEQTVWRLSSNAGETAELERHLEDLGERAEELGLLDPEKLPSDLIRTLRVAVLHDGASCSVEFSSVALFRFLAARFNLEVSLYPTAGGPEGSSEVEEHS
jgi:hypothetical protein